MKIYRIYCIFIFPILLITSCATPTDSSILLRASAMRSEGFIATENKHFDEFWVKPGINISSYTKIIFQRSGLQYQEVNEARKPQSTSYQTYHITE